ncbi:MAG: PEP-CTERM-box response regulator transcription factor [Proteobacteria bacterium]|nr:PEP-CTERM-box response regulator transcription factor [Pseudomonadota bacterium]
MDERRLLIIEDDVGLQSQMQWCFEDTKVFVAGRASEAEAIARKEEPQVVTLDLGLPPNAGGASEGFKLLDRIKELMPRTKIIVITGREEREHSLQAIASGAYDFYQKPIDSDTLRFVVDRAFRLWELEEENVRLANSNSSTALQGLITGAENMFAVCTRTERVAPTDATVLILGETGTGKEIIARALHNLSERAAGPMAVINCAAIPEALLESELFGHEKGSFTGASARKIGKVESANKGTLFLDEIGDMPLALQAKILRFLQERTVERVGSNVSIPVDVRVVAATHRPLQKMVASGEFREDLFFRLSEISIDLPPLRDRNGDAVLIGKSLVNKFANGRMLSLRDDAVAAIEQWSWPGNVRELENKIKRACILTDGPTIGAEDLELKASVSSAEPLNLREVRSLAEKSAIARALQRSENNVSQAARLLGVSRPTLYNLFSKYDISIEGSSD